MILSKPGEHCMFAGITYEIGARVYAKECSIYSSLIGTVTEIRTDTDKETENPHPDIYVDFMLPVQHTDKIALEERFAQLYGYHRPLADIPLNSVIMAPISLKPLPQENPPQMELTAYLLCENWYADGQGERSVWLYTDYEDAKAVFRSMLCTENIDGILAKWENHPDRMENSKKDFFECWLDGQYAAYHYSLSITPQKLVMSQNAVSEIYNIQLAANRAEDFLEEISQWEETEDLTEEQLAEMVQFTDIPNRIKEKLSTNSTYWSAYYESLSEASYEAVKAYLAHIRSEADPPYEG